MDVIHEGGCLCGEVRYRARGEPLMAMICHCRFCQRRTGSAFAEAVFFPEDRVEFSRAPRSQYEHRSDESGRWMRLEFCPRCGTTMSWISERRPGVRAVAAGSLDAPESVTFNRHIWTRSAQPWMTFPASVECLEKGAPS
ncbi:MAG: GFA family protein [Burkholderiales bacterium]